MGWRSIQARLPALWQLAVHRPQRVVLICFVAVMLLTMIVAWRELYVLREGELEARQAALRLQAHGLDAIAVIERRRLDFVRDYAEHLIDVQSGAAKVPPDAALQAAFAARDSPVWQLALPPGDAPLIGIDGARLQGIPGFAREDRELLADLYVGRAISRILTISVRRDAVAVQATYISTNGFFASYPPVDPTYADELIRRMATMPYFTATLPQANPDRTPHIVPTYRDYRTKALLVTACIPVYHDDRLRGVIVFDIPQERIRQLLAAPHRGSTVMLADREGRLLASTADHPPGTLDWLRQMPGEWGALTSDQLRAQRSGRFQSGGDYLLFERLPDSGGIVAEAIPMRALYGALLLHMSQPLVLIWVMLGLLLWATLRVVNQLFDDHLALEQTLRRMAQTDPLTGLANRRHFWELHEAEAQRRQRHDIPLALLMVDIDHFKRINDTWGHASGDRVLQALAAVCRRELRPSDVAARLGGEEFGVLLPQSTLAQATATAERLRAALAATPVDAGDMPGTIRFTVSIGVAEYDADAPDGLDDFLAIADRRLYAAKMGGRNRVVDSDGTALPPD